MSDEMFHAVVQGVYAETLGDPLSVAVPALLTTVLHVYDVADFDEDGGWLRLAGTLREYTSIDDDASTITLATGITGPIEVDTFVELWDDANSQKAVVYKAVVDQIDGFDGVATAIVSQGVAHVLSQTMRDGTGESVSLAREGSELQLVAVHGRGFSLASMQYLQGGMTTRQNDTDAGVDIVGADSGLPGISAYAPGGAQTVFIDATTGNASFTGEVGTAKPGDLGIFMYSQYFSYMGAQQAIPVIQFNVGTNRDQPSIQADTVGSSNLYLYSGGNNLARETQVFVGSGEFKVGIEHVADDGAYGGAVLDFTRTAIAVHTDDGIGPGGFQTAWVKAADDECFFGYDNGGSRRGVQVLSGANDWTRIWSANRVDFVGPGGTTFQALIAEKIESSANGMWMLDLAGGGTTTASIGNSGRLIRTTSSRRYKHSIRDLDLEAASQVVDGFRARTFKRKKLDPAEPTDPRRYAGAIAEELAEIPAAEPFIIRDADGNPDGIHYPELVAAVIPVVRDQDRRLAEQQERIERLEALVADLLTKETS